MKKILKLIALSAFLLIFAGVAVSCNVTEKTEGNVPFRPCECENPLAWIQFPRGEAYLFRDSIPLEMAERINIQMYSSPFPNVSWIVYCSETGIAAIHIGNLHYPGGGNILTTGPICNFHDFAKEWDIPKNGIKVYFEGRMYETCSPFGWDNVVPIDYVLTNLEKRERR